jgi:hypothetical protein
MSEVGETDMHSAVRYADGSVLRYATAPPPAQCIFFSLRFGAEHGVVPMAEELRAALETRGMHAIIINMLAGGDISEEVFQWIEHCDTFVVFGSAHYGEKTGNQACTYYEYEYAFGKKKRIILLRMIPWEQEFQELKGRVIFGANKLAVPWMVGQPLPISLPDQILQAIQKQPIGLRTLGRSHSEPVASATIETQPAQPSVAGWPAALNDLVSVESFLACMKELDIHNLVDFGEIVDLDEVSRAESSAHSQFGSPFLNACVW